MSDSSANVHAIRFPNESPEYRTARDELLRAEMDLRRQQEAVAAQRRSLPLGGEVSEDYVFVEAGGDAAVAGREVRLSELFAPGKATLIVYSYMFGPAMERPCTSCTSILDGIDGEAPHVVDRVNLAVVAKSPPERIAALARERGWRHMRLLSSAGNSYNRDYQGENAKGAQMPALNVFSRRDGKVFHTYAAELLFAPSEPGQDGRHVDAIWPLWNLFDYTPEGRGEKWYPKLLY
ncbi:MAG TPA: DUF899 family protein [Thermoanaerobaculia bacterium]|jgi:predicted dithiol-disulfide oxidoreductase (DUF899 family)|nr:DUF899 family protein [Thermoanaerobaculia bacterium]